MMCAKETKERTSHFHWSCKSHSRKTLAGLVTEATPCEHAHLYDLVRNEDNIELKFHNLESSQLILDRLDTIDSITYQKKTDKPAIKYVVMGLAPDNTADFIERYVTFNHQKREPTTKPRVKVIYQGPGAKEDIAVAAFATDSEHIAAQVARTEHLRFGPWQLKTWAFTDYNMCHQCHVPFHHTNQCRRTPACSVCGDTNHPAQSCPDTNNKTVHYCMSCKMNGHTSYYRNCPVYLALNRQHFLN